MCLSVGGGDGVPPVRDLKSILMIIRDIHIQIVCLHDFRSVH